MPIVDIEVVAPADGEGACSKELVRRLANALGEVFESRPTGTWVRVRYLPDAHYAENAESSEHPEYPIFVSVLKAQLPAKGVMAEEMRRVGVAVAAAFDRPEENVHVLYEPEASGRIAFGGRLRSK